MAAKTFQEGDRVEVIRGRYKGCQGIVDDHGIEGVPVLIEAHGRPLHMVEIPAASLRRIEPPAE